MTSAALGTKARVEEEREAVYIGGIVNATGVCNIQLTSFLLFTLSSFPSLCLQMIGQCISDIQFRGKKQVLPPCDDGQVEFN